MSISFVAISPSHLLDVRVKASIEYTQLISVVVEDKRLREVAAGRHSFTNWRELCRVGRVNVVQLNGVGPGVDDSKPSGFLVDRDGALREEGAKVWRLTLSTGTLCGEGAYVGLKVPT